MIVCNVSVCILNTSKFILLLFINQKIVLFLFFFFIFWYASFPSSCRMVCCRHQLFAFIFFTWIVLFKSIIPTHTFDLNNILRNIFIKIRIVKVLSKNYKNCQRTTLKIPISSLKNMILPESSLKKIIS